MNRLRSNSRGGSAYVALASLGVMFFALVVSAYAGKDRPASDASSPVLKTAGTLKVLSTANMPLDNRTAGTPASRAAVTAANGSGGGIAGCPASSCVGGDCTLTQSLDTATNGENQVACGIAKLEQTTPNGWARCYNLVDEGVPAGQNLTINSVTFGVQQATIDGINIDVVLWVDIDGCPPDEPGVDAAVLASQSVVVNMADVGSMITVEFPAGPVVAAGSDLIVEIVSVDDGTVPPEFQFRTMSNPNGQCGPSYIRTPDGSCGLVSWVDLAALGFPDAHLIQVISATVGGTPSGACCFGDESCQFLSEAACNAAGGTYQGDGTGCAGGICDIIPEACGPGAGSCQEPHPTPGCDDEDCCAAVCDINPACCALQWDALCVQLALKICLPEPGTCDAPFNTEVTQNVDNVTIDTGGVACAGGGITTENSWARSYDLSAIPDTAGQDFSINCVEFAMNNSGSELVGTVTIFEDTDGGQPGSPGTDLVVLGSKAFTLPGGADLQLFQASFDPPVVAPADSTIVVAVDLPPSNDGFAVYAGNMNGESGCTYLLSASCDIGTYTCAGDLGFPDLHMLQNIRGDVGVAEPCPWDLNGSGDVGILDLLALLAAWGACPPPCPPDFDGGGTVDIFDLLTLIANWGACP